MDQPSVAPRVDAASDLRQEDLGRVTGAIHESVAAQLVVKSFSLHERLRAEFQDRLDAPRAEQRAGRALERAARRGDDRQQLLGAGHRHVRGHAPDAAGPAVRRVADRLLRAGVVHRVRRRAAGGGRAALPAGRGGTAPDPGAPRRAPDVADAPGARAAPPPRAGHRVPRRRLRVRRIEPDPPGRQRDDPRPALGGHRRTERLREVDHARSAAAAPRSERGHGDVRRHGPPPRDAGVAPEPGRRDAPGELSLRPVGPGEHPARPAGRDRRGGRGGRAGRRHPRNPAAAAPGLRHARRASEARGSRAASASGSRSPGPWCGARPSSSWTSPPRRSTPRRRPPSSRRSAGWRGIAPSCW